MRKTNPYPLYIFMEGMFALLFAMIFTASSVYQVTVVGLSALQLILVGLFGFALSGSFEVAVAAFLLIYVARNVIAPVYSAWVNQRLDSRVRATVHSMSSQADAIGQIAGGPLVGVIGNVLSVQAALLTSSLILSPVLVLYRAALRNSARDIHPEAFPVDQ